ncbi:hypothetical protein D081_0736 [Anaerovibrio sp. JC8]|uniref:DUF2939 domain-containing protein n=1 Tax=Anaerovibrio sp. JC8 TaxID=1240085 RepID=UPI000A0A7C15|nr:DUF2939 domain-containing protein [Anaerovibrio sp. JC8]ORU00754.1 hypothetical protein D081_0736 [Anaerovibrio sp. JC8]
MSSFARSVKYRLLAILAVVLVAAAGGAWWYATYYTNTPEYALKMIQECVENHDKDKIRKYIDFEHLLDTSSDALLEGLVDANIPAVGDAKDAVSSFTRMFKAPVSMSLQMAIDNYVEYGQWTKTGNSEGAGGIDADMVVQKSGIGSTSFRGLDSMAVDGDNGTAVAKVRVFQEEANEEFILDMEFVKKDNGGWQLYEITNLKDFITMVNHSRRDHVKVYLEQSAAIMTKHDAKVMSLEQDASNILGSGSLGSDDTRKALKKLMLDGVVPEWQARKGELEDMNVPAAAGSLHRLRIKICDLHIDYAQGYAKWMDDKNASTIRTADASLKQAKTLEKEAELLTRQVNSHIK